MVGEQYSKIVNNFVWPWRDCNFVIAAQETSEYFVAM